MTCKVMLRAGCTVLNRSAAGNHSTTVLEVLLLPLFSLKSSRGEHSYVFLQLRAVGDDIQFFADLDFGKKAKHAHLSLRFNESKNKLNI